MVAIMEIEKTLRGKKMKRSNANMMKGILLTIVLSCSAITNVSVNASIIKSNRDAIVAANKAYAKGNFQQAASCYTELLKTEKSAELYYNLGNCEYRLGNITQSIIAYERALRLNPSDRDTRYNLQFLRSKTIDRVVSVDEMFFVTWYHSLQNFLSIDAWATLAIISFVFALVFMLVYLLGRQIVLRKVGFFGGTILFVLFLVSILFACQRKAALSEHDIAIVLSPTLNVKATPSESSSDAFVLHEGTSLTITDRSMNKWYGVRLDDGTEGWIPKQSVEVI